MNHPLCIGPAPALDRIEILDSFTPGQPNRVRQTVLRAAGKAINTAYALRRLGYTPTVAGFLGGHHGALIRRQLKDAGIQDAHTTTQAETRLCTTLAAPNQTTEIIEPPAAPATGEEQAQFLDTCRTLIPQASIVLLTGTCPPFLPEKTYATLAQIVQNATIPLIVDTSGKALLSTLPSNPLLVKINTTELAQTGATPKQLIDLGAANLLVTDGPAEATLYTPKNTIRLKPQTIQEVNPIGSGDAANAGFIHAWYCAQPVENAAAIALACATASATTLTPSDLDPETIDNYLPQVIQ